MRTVNQYYRALSKKDESAFIYFSFNGDGIDEVNAKAPSQIIGVNFNGAGILGSALTSGDGATDVLFYADHEDFSFTAGGGVDLPFSFSFWMNPTSIVGFGAWIINKRNAAPGGDEYQISLGLDGRIRLTLFDRFNPSRYISIHSVSTAFGALNGMWKHVVITYDGSKSSAGINFYLNANLEAITDLSVGVYTGMANGTARLAFLNGGWQQRSTTKFYGKLDEFGIWKNKILTPSQVSFLYNNGAGVPYPLTGL